MRCYFRKTRGACLPGFHHLSRDSIFATMMPVYQVFINGTFFSFSIFFVLFSFFAFFVFFEYLIFLYFSFFHFFCIFHILYFFFCIIKAPVYQVFTRIIDTSKHLFARFSLRWSFFQDILQFLGFFAIYQFLGFFQDQ